MFEAVPPGPSPGRASNTMHKCSQTWLVGKQGGGRENRSSNLPGATEQCAAAHCSCQGSLTTCRSQFNDLMVVQFKRLARSQCSLTTCRSNTPFKVQLDRSL